MGKLVSWKPPILFQSKLLCLSLLCLVTTLALSIYTSLSTDPYYCIFRLSPSSSPPPHRQHDHTVLFSYPSAYGERKHALPRSNTSCNSPLLFPEYHVAHREIHDLCRNASPPSSSQLRYLTTAAAAKTFAGDLSTQRRKSYFNHRQDDDGAPVPCGFLKQFPVKESDRMAMEECKGVVVASAIFGDHDKIRQPKGLGAQTLRSACFFMFIDDSTLQGLNAHNILLSEMQEEHHHHHHRRQGYSVVGAWRIVRVSPTEEGEGLPYENPAMNGVIPKHLIHRLFPNAKYSIWVDAKLQLTVDPYLLIHSLLVSKQVDMAISKHPFNVHTMEEAMATARWKKWADVEALRLQMETYCHNGLQPWSPSKLPYTTDVPDTALIVRRHGVRSDLFSCLLFNELEAFNPRDQLAFAYVRDLMNPKIRINTFSVEIFEHIAVEYRHNLKPTGTGTGSRRSRDNKITRRRVSSRGINGSSCEQYLLKMWGEST